jgi:hypothetical protein
VLVKLTCSTRRQNNSARIKRPDPICPGLDKCDTNCTAIFDYERLSAGMGAKLDRWHFSGPGDQGPNNLATGSVAMSMQDAAAGVGGLAREHKLVALAVELGAMVDQLDDITRALFDQNLDCFLIAQPGPCVDRILEVKRNIVIIVQNDSYTALGVLGI